MTTKDHSQDDSFIVKGHWWLPHGTERVAGDLNYEEKDVTLSLYGGLNEASFDSPFSATPKSIEFPIILGESLENVPFTLLQSFYTSWTPNRRSSAERRGTSVSLRASELTCTFAVEGLHLTSPNESFLKCRVEIPYFDAWLGTSPFSVKSENLYERIQIAYDRPNQEEFEVTAASCRFRIVHAVTPPALPMRASASIGHTAYLELEPFTPRPFEWYCSYASEIVSLLALLYGENLNSHRLRLERKQDDLHDISLFYRRHEVEVEKYGKLDFLMRPEKVGKSLQDLLQAWFSAPPAFVRARRMLLSSARRPASFMELQFLPLVHAAEILSGESKHATYIEKSRFRAIQKDMLSSLPDDISDDLQQSIKTSLGHSNGRNLRNKLTCMLNDLSEETRRLFCVDSSTFVNGVVNTRHHYTHYSTRVGDNLLHGTQLYWAIRKLSLMIRILLLKHLGIGEKEIQEAVRSHRRLSGEQKVWSNVSEEGTPYAGIVLESE